MNMLIPYQGYVLIIKTLKKEPIFMHAEPSGQQSYNTALHPQKTARRKGEVIRFCSASRPQHPHRLTKAGKHRRRAVVIRLQSRIQADRRMAAGPRRPGRAGKSRGGPCGAHATSFRHWPAPSSTITKPRWCSWLHGTTCQTRPKRSMHMHACMHDRSMPPRARHYDDSATETLAELWSESTEQWRLTSATRCVVVVVVRRA